LACVSWIIRVCRYAGKAAATGERVDADRRYAIGDGYAGKAGAIAEHVVADRRYAIGDGYTGKAGATVERVVADRRYAIGDGYTGKAGATVEHVVADRRYACADGYAGKVSAIVERIVADSGNLAFCRERYAGNGGIASKRVAAARINAIADLRYGQVIAVIQAVGGYMYRSSCRTIAGGFIVDAVGGVAVDKLKIKPCRAGGIEGMAVFGVRGIMFARYYFHAVLCFGGCSYGGIGSVPVVSVDEIYGDSLRSGVQRIVGTSVCFYACCYASSGRCYRVVVIPVVRVRVYGYGFGI